MAKKKRTNQAQIDHFLERMEVRAQMEGKTFKKPKKAEAAPPKSKPRAKERGAVCK